MIARASRGVLSHRRYLRRLRWYLSQRPASAQNLPWCAIMDNDGNTQCNYSTLQQCLQTLSGIGGRCIENPSGSPPQSRLRRLRRKMRRDLQQLQLQNPGPPPGFGGAMPPPPNN